MQEIQPVGHWRSVATPIDVRWLQAGKSSVRYGPQVKL